MRNTPIRLPVKLQRDLHATLGVRLHAPQAPVVVLKRGAAAQRAELGPVQQVKRLPPEVQTLLFPLEVDAPRQRKILVETRPTAQLWIEPGLVAEPGSRLCAKVRHGLEEAVHIRIELA